VPRAAAAGAAGESFQFGLCCRCVGACLFMADMDPFYLSVPSYCIVEFVQTIAGDGIDPFYIVFNQHIDQLVCYFPAHMTVFLNG
jgi:hypothetical protein